MSYESQLKELQILRDQVTSLAQFVESKEKQIKQQESLIAQGQMPSNAPQNLQYNLQHSLGPLMAPGNVGDLNSVIWPYYFTTETPDSSLAPNQTFQTGFSVTQEAAFIMMSFTKTVYLDTAGQWGYLDENLNPSAPGLQFTFRDGSSSRQLFNTPINMDLYGNPRFPSKFSRPIMLLPNQVMQIQFINTHPTNSYVPFITAFGYRIRIEEAQKFLSLVYA